MPMCLLRILLLIGFVFCGAGCETTAPARVGEAAPQVRLTVRNLTRYHWRVVVRSGEVATTRTVEVDPLATVNVELVRGGNYEIEQTLIGVGTADAATRRFPAQFQAGQAYEWSLATVKLVEDDSAGPAAPAETAARE